jgi:hypothetical protein
VRSKSNQDQLSHVLVCGGTTSEWSSLSMPDWERQLNVLVRSLEGSGARWLTLCPARGRFSSSDAERVLALVCGVTGGSVLPHRGVTEHGTVSSRASFIGEGGLICIVDVCTDGRQRFVDSVNSVPVGVAIEEGVVESALFAPALADPDLVLIFGPPTQLPESLMWELAYSELVFLDTSWTQCNAEHVHMAIDDFQRRERRFGGIDS